MRLFVILSFLLSALNANSNTILDLDDLKPVQYPLLEKSSLTGHVQNLFIDFTASVKRGCERNFGLNYASTDLLKQISALKFARDVKSACLFPYLVHQLNDFSKEHLLHIKKYNIPQNNMHLTLASRIYDGNFLEFIDQLPEEENANKRFYDIYDISTHSAILYRMIRQTLEDAIVVSNPWFAQNSLDTIRDIRKIAGWISEVSPWSYFYRIGFSTTCDRSPFKQRCELDKKLIQVALMKSVQSVRANPDQYGYFQNFKTTYENMANEHKNSIRRGLQVLRGLAGEFVPYMPGSPSARAPFEA